MCNNLNVIKAAGRWASRSLAGMVALTAALAFAEATPEPAPVERLFASINTIRTLEAEFQQRVSAANGEVLQKSTGSLLLQRPDKLFWHTKPPYEQMIVSDGHTLWVYDPDLEQVTVHKSQPDLQGPIAMLGKSLDELKMRYTITQQAKDGVHRFKMVPKTDDPADNFSELEFGFINDQLIEISMLDKLRQRTTITIERSAQNAEIDPKYFTFIPPKGVDIVENE